VYGAQQPGREADDCPPYRANLRMPGKIGHYSIYLATWFSRAGTMRVLFLNSQRLLPRFAFFQSLKLQNRSPKLHHSIFLPNPF